VVTSVVYKFCLSSMKDLFCIVSLCSSFWVVWTSLDLSASKPCLTLFSVLAEFVPALHWLGLGFSCLWIFTSLRDVQWQVLAPRTDFVLFWLAHWSTPFSGLPIR
jgi:hypothetical protein